MVPQSPAIPASRRSPLGKIILIPLQTPKPLDRVEYEHSIIEEGGHFESGNLLFQRWNCPAAARISLREFRRKKTEISQLPRHSRRFSYKLIPLQNMVLHPSSSALLSGSYPLCTLTRRKGYRSVSRSSTTILQRYCASRWLRRRDQHRCILR